MVASTITDSDSETITDDSDSETKELWDCVKDIEDINIHRDINVVYSLRNREIYGRFARSSRSRTEKCFNNIPKKCSTYLQNILPKCEFDVEHHIFMGFSSCSQYMFSYTAILNDGDLGPYNMFGTVEYMLYIWKYVPFKRLKLVSKHQIFRHAKSSDYMCNVSFSQWPGDCYKLVCYGQISDVQITSYVTILTVPTSGNCLSCYAYKDVNSENHQQGWCAAHGFTVDYMYSLQFSNPSYIPKVSLAYPDNMVINTGHHIHILNIAPPTETQPLQPLTLAELIKAEDPRIAEGGNQSGCLPFNDAFSERSETPISEHFENNSVVDAIIQDFNEYDSEGIECSKPFHELNISCEPLNVTGKSYHSLVDTRIKRSSANSNNTSITSTNAEKPKIDKKIAEKAYEFTEENEKFEKFSSFRKKRFADKKYEFSEDNSENIVPFNSLRHQRRYLYRSQSSTRCMRVPDMTNIYFLSPLSPGLRSPILSPNSRNCVYYPSLRSPHYSRSPLSPRDSARKFNVYSPSLDSDISDADSKLILRTVAGNMYATSRDSFTDSLRSATSQQNSNSLLIVDSVEDAPGWIKKVVRRYSSLDFDTSSLVSGQSRDDFNTPIELPLLVNPLIEHDIDFTVSKYNLLVENETQLIVSQRTFDCEQFIQRRAEQLCEEACIHYTHCVDYDVSLLQICPLSGDIVCGVTFKIGALKKLETSIPTTYLTRCMFIWNIETDSFKVIETSSENKLIEYWKNDNLSSHEYFSQFKFPKLSCMQPTAMRHTDREYSQINCKSLKYLRDLNNYIEISLDPPHICPQQLIEDDDLPYDFNFTQLSETYSF